MMEMMTAAAGLTVLAAFLVFAWNVAGELFDVPQGLPLWREAVWRYAAVASRYAWLVAAIILLAPILALQAIAYSEGYSGWIEMVRNWLTVSLRSAG